MQKKFVVPGEFMGTEEEYVPGSGTFMDGERIYATISGDAKDEQRTLTVAQKPRLEHIGVGAVIIGVVGNVIEPIALVSINRGSEAGSRYGDSPDNAVLHASMIRRGYVKNVRDEMKIGDIIRAKVVDVRNGELRLSTDAEDLGVIKAFCAKCRHPMEKGGETLQCESCGAKDNRKTASDYRSVKLDG